MEFLDCIKGRRSRITSYNVCYTKLLRNLDAKNAGILAEKNVDIAICTDHPVIPVQYLFMSAAVAAKNGLAKQKVV